LIMLDKKLHKEYKELTNYWFYWFL